MPVFQILQGNKEVHRLILLLLKISEVLLPHQRQCLNKPNQTKSNLLQSIIYKSIWAGDNFFHPMLAFHSIPSVAGQTQWLYGWHGGSCSLSFCPVCVLDYQRTPHGSLYFTLEILDFSSTPEFQRSYEAVYTGFLHFLTPCHQRDQQMIPFSFLALATGKKLANIGHLEVAGAYKHRISTVQ